MKSVYYGLFQNHFWHCLECLSTAKNIDYTKLFDSTKVLLAQELDMSNANLGYKISSKNNIRINSLLKIANVLDVDIVEFFRQ